MAPQLNLEQERRALLASHIYRLVSTPEWEFFQKEAKEMEQRALEALASVHRDDFQKQQGILYGIREVLKLPNVLLAQGKRL